MMVILMHFEIKNVSYKENVITTSRLPICWQNIIIRRDCNDRC